MNNQSREVTKPPLYEHYTNANKVTKIKIIEELKSIGIRYSVLGNYLRSIPAWKMSYPMAKIIIDNIPDAEPLFERPKKEG